MSDRLRRFLSFVVAETLAGRGDRIKAYAIGVDVFGRGDDFDPNSDPIVRIEATRLRTSLSAYYESAGARDPVRILIPPGSYMPTFAWSAASADPAASSQVKTRARAFVIKHQTDPRDRCGIARGELLVESLVGRLSKAGFKVYATPPPERKAAARAVREMLLNPDESYALDVAVHALADGRRFSWSVTSLATGEFICSDFADRADDGAPGAAMIDCIADRAAGSIMAVLGETH